MYNGATLSRRSRVLFRKLLGVWNIVPITDRIVSIRWQAHIEEDENEVKPQLIYIYPLDQQEIGSNVKFFQFNIILNST